MKKTTTYFLFFTLLTTSLNAEVAEPFLLESFNNGFPAAWSTDDYSNQNVKWKQCDNPQACPPASFVNLSCNDPLLRSPGFHDGYMYVDSYGAGFLPNPSQPYLRTATIDCSAKNDVFLRFHTYIHSVNGSPETNAILRVKSGNGAWEEFTIFPDLNLAVINSLQGYNSQLIQLDISSAAANKPNVTIEWRWTANYEIAWMIDDVALFDEDPMQENMVWGGGNGDFSSGQNNWTVLNNELDTCRWVWVDSAMLHIPNGDALAAALACWPGVNDGAMLLNASYCSRYGQPTPYTRSDLQSPAINLTNVPTGTKLYLRFHQAVDLANNAAVGLPKTSVAVSVDNGLSFIDTIDANPLLQYLHAECGEVSLPLPLAVAGKPQVRLRFIFSGDTHFWLVDDVRIARAYDHDVELNASFFNVAPDYGVPGSQVRPIQLFAQARNSGNLAASNLMAYAEVRNASHESVFLDSVAVDMLEPNESWTDLQFPNKFLPDSSPDEYLFFYWLSGSEADQNPNNNRAYWRYQVTGDVFSKNEFCSTSIGYFTPTESVAYEIGNCYYIPKGSKLKANSLSFAFKNVSDLENENAELSIRLYRWSKGDSHGDMNLDTLANPSEFEAIGFNTYNVDGSENGKVVTVPIVDLEGEEVILEDDNYYFVTVGYLEPVFNNGQPEVFPIAASEAVNYTAMFYNSYTDSVPAFVSMLREGDETDFRANAWALRRIPFVNLNVADYVNGADEKKPLSGRLSVVPNPASDFVRVTAENLSPNQPTSMEIFDLCGRRVWQEHFKSGNVSQQPIPVGELSNGCYTLRVISGDKLFTEKLMIVH